jgi:predicted ester cyclase/quinol monooxygenase YgiN
MFGTIARLRPKAGRQADVIRLFEEWGRERGPRVAGALGGYLMRPLNRPDEHIAVAIFADRATYEANANDPQQDAWYRRLREVLEADPIWEDGEYVVSGLAGEQVAEANKAIVRRIEEAWNANNLAALDELFAPDFVAHNAVPGMPPGLDGAKMAHQAAMQGFPDRRTAIEDLVGAGDTVVVRVRMTGTNQGGLPWFGVPANGNKVTVTWISIYRLAAGKVVEHRAEMDIMGLMQQLGAIPSPSQAPAAAGT